MVHAELPNRAPRLDGSFEVGLVLAELEAVPRPAFDLESLRREHEMRQGESWRKDALSHSILLPVPRISPCGAPAEPGEEDMRGWIDALRDRAP